MSDDFEFKKKNKGVLSQEVPKKSKAGRPKTAVPRKNRVICYFSDDEFAKVQDFLDGRPASSYLRHFILEKIEQT